ncbi:hypothetical protein ASG50_16240 [Rhizobium sp. Leaf386]|nr:hypothetical protein ASG50_16240 [Rhizobium sp. Leaf386]
MTLFAEIVLSWKATDLRFLNKKQPLGEPLFDDRNDGGVTLDADLGGFVDLGIEGKRVTSTCCCARRVSELSRYFAPRDIHRMYLPSLQVNEPWSECFSSDMNCPGV